MGSILNTSYFSDSELTVCAIEGQRDAFPQIVMRYQSLVCSLAYSATGSLSFLSLDMIFGTARGVMASGPYSAFRVVLLRIRTLWFGS
jgi:hypothetical protein